MQHKVGRKWVPDGPRIVRGSGCDYMNPRRAAIMDKRGWGSGYHTKGSIAPSWRDTNRRQRLTKSV